MLRGGVLRLQSMAALDWLGACCSSPLSLTVLGLLLVASPASASGSPTKLIIDTDIGGGACNDVDDVVAVAIGNALADNGEVELLAIVQNTAPVDCAGAISVLNTYYGRGSLSTLPIGAYNVNTPGATLQMEQPLDYVSLLGARFPSAVKNTSSAGVEDAVALYRRVLAAQMPHSVAISSIGIHTNLAALLKSPPDATSRLSGIELVAEKVFLLAVMGGKYPRSGDAPECNVCGGRRNEHNHFVASVAASYVAAHWPPSSKVIWSGYELGVMVQSGGATFQRCSAAKSRNPVKAAMVSYMGGPNRSRFSWDPLTTLVAARGVEHVPSVAFCEGCDGVNLIDAKTGENRWVAGAPRNQTYLVLKDAKGAGDAIDRLLCQKPMLAWPRQQHASDCSLA